MKLLPFAIAALVAATALPASAQMMHRHGHMMRSCHMEYRHHHQVRVCHMR